MNPDATIYTGPIEQWSCDPGRFDLAVGNVPFAKYAPYDPAANAERHSLHNYVLLRGLTALKPGGLMAMITSHYTLDATNPASRRALAELGDLLAAVRPASTWTTCRRGSTRCCGRSTGTPASARTS